MFDFLTTNPALALLKKDHDTVKDLFDRFEKTEAIEEELERSLERSPPRLGHGEGSPGAPARPRDAPPSALKMLKNAPICSRRTSPMSMRCHLEANTCAQ